MLIWRCRSSINEAWREAGQAHTSAMEVQAELEQELEAAKERVALLESQLKQRASSVAEDSNSGIAVHSGAWHQMRGE